MRKSLSKKILAMFLAVLMLVTAVPLTSFAATDQEHSKLEAAITEYETKMRNIATNGTVYTNMKAAYDAYISAKEIEDAYAYGKNTSVDLVKATNDLTTATAAMENYVAPVIQFTVPEWFGLGAGHIEKQSVNVLYADAAYKGTSNSACNYIKWSDGQDRADIGVYYGTTVLLYDGVNTPQFPIMASGKAKVSFFSPLDFTNLFPAEAEEFDESKQADNSSFRLSTTSGGGNLKDAPVWIGGRQGGNNSYDFNLTEGNGTEHVKGLHYDKNSEYKNYYAVDMNTQRGVWYFSSSLKYLNSIQPTEYTKDYLIPWIAETAVGVNNASKYGTMTAKNHVYVVNYKAVQGALEDALKLPQLFNVASYNEKWSDMSQLMGVIDQATTFNPNNYDYATDTAAAIQTCDNDIKKIVKGIESGFKISNDSAAYNDLRKAIDLSTSKIEDGNGPQETPTYEKATWDRFEKAYNNAIQKMANLPTEHYNNAAVVAELEKELTAARQGLVRRELVNFDYYNGTKAELLKRLAEGGWTAESLEKVSAALTGLTYFEEKNQVNVPISEKDAVEAERLKFEEAIRTLKKADNSTLDAITETIKTLNADECKVASVQTVFESAPKTKPVMVLGTEYQGCIYDDVVTKVLTAITDTSYDYTVKVVNEANGKTTYVVYDAETGATTYTADETQATKFHYDDKVTVTSAVTGYDNDPYDWAAEVVAQNTASQIVRKVVNTNATSYQFNVRGNTTLYVSAASGSASHKVTFKDSRSGESIAFAYAQGNTFDITSVGIPTPIYYDVEGYTCDASGVTIEGTTISGITSDIDVTVKFVPTQSAGEYQIKFVDETGKGDKIFNAKYNELVTFSAPQATCFTDINGKVLWVGNEYKFYACQNITVVAKADATLAEQASKTVNVTVSAPVVANGATMFVGSFAPVPKGYEVLNYGVVIDVDGKYPTDLSLAKVDKTDHVYNMSASKCDATTNQFVVGIRGTSYANSNYASYVICKDSNGYKHIFYSEIANVNA